MEQGSGCASQVGRAGGMQYVSLGTGCVYAGIAQHELMHSTGFWHEQSRADRDDYIRILWENIEPGMEELYMQSSVQSMKSTIRSTCFYGSFVAFQSNTYVLTAYVISLY